MTTRQTRTVVGPFLGPDSIEHMTFTGDTPERTLHTFYPDQLWKAEALVELAARFPHTKIECLSKETTEPTCSICQVDYQTAYVETTDPQKTDNGEHPVKLSCGHVFGHDCLSRWLVQNSCPLCRTPLFQDFQTDGGLVIVPLENAGLLMNLEAVEHLMSALHDPLAGTDHLRHMRASMRAPEREEFLKREAIGGANAERASQDHEFQRIASRRMHLLYRYLQGKGVVLPNASTFDATVHKYLEKEQHRALFRHLQRQGAFHYPGMDWFFSRRSEHPLSDEVIYVMLEEMGLWWQPYGSWETRKGLLVWASAELWTRLDELRHADALESNAVVERFVVYQEDVAPINPLLDMDEVSIMEAPDPEDVGPHQSKPRWFSVKYIVRQAFSSPIDGYRLRRRRQMVQF